METGPAAQLAFIRGRGVREFQAMYSDNMHSRHVRRAACRLILAAAVVSIGGICELGDRDLGQPAMIPGPDQDEEFFPDPSRSPAGDPASDPGGFAPLPPPPIAPNPPLPPIPGLLPPIVPF